MSMMTRDPISKIHDAGMKVGVGTVALKVLLALGLDPETAAMASFAIQALGGLIGSTLRDGEFLKPSEASGLKRFILMLCRNIIG